MSIFKQKLERFLGTPWDSQVDIALNNRLIKQKGKMLDDQVAGQQFISSFIENNAQLIAQASSDFQDGIAQLPSYMTEATYDLFAEKTSLQLYLGDGGRFGPELVKAVKQAVKREFGWVVREDIEDPTGILVVPNVDLIKIKPLETVLKKLNRKIKTRPISSPQHNIAAKVNKREEEMRRRLQEPSDIHANTNKKIPLMAENIKDTKDAYLLVEKMLRASDIAYESVSLGRFVGRNFDRVKRIVESGTDAIDTLRIYALMEADGLKEMTTADMSVPSLPAGPLQHRDRLKNFDPFGKNVANTSNGTKAVIKMDADVLRESISKLDMSKINLIGTDIETSHKHSRVIIEHAGKKHELTIEKNDFLRFVERNGDVRSYMKDGRLDVKRYFESRTTAFLGTLLKEYFRKILKEEQVHDFKVEDFEISGDDMSIYYYFPQEADVRTVRVSTRDFEDFVHDEYQDEIESNRKQFYTHSDDTDFENPRGSYTFDFGRFFDNFSYPEQLNLVKQYMVKKGIGKVNESSVGGKQVDDYNEWKDMVATRTGGDFNVTGAKGSNVSIAIDGEGRKVGRWDPNKTSGEVY